MQAGEWSLRHIAGENLMADTRFKMLMGLIGVGETMAVQVCIAEKACGCCNVGFQSAPNA